MKDDLLWEKVLKRIKNEVNSLVYATWFEKTKLKIIDGNKAIIYVPTEIHQRRLLDHYYDVILNNLLKEIDEVEKVSFALEDKLDEEKEDSEYVARHAVRNYS